MKKEDRAINLYMANEFRNILTAVITVSADVSAYIYYAIDWLKEEPQEVIGRPCVRKSLKKLLLIVRKIEADDPNNLANLILLPLTGCLEEHAISKLRELLIQTAFHIRTELPAEQQMMFDMMNQPDNSINEEEETIETVKNELLTFEKQGC